MYNIYACVHKQYTLMGLNRLNVQVPFTVLKSDYFSKKTIKKKKRYNATILLFNNGKCCEVIYKYFIVFSILVAD